MTHKVVHIITRLDAGGSATNTIETVARLDKKKYTTFLVYGKTHDPDGEIKAWLQNKNIKGYLIDDLRRNIHPGRDIKALIQLWKILRKEKPDLVHTHTSKAGILGRWAAQWAGVRVIVHTPHGHVFYGYFGKRLTSLFVFLEKITGWITDKIIALTDIGQKDHLHFRIAPADKFVTIPSGIDITKFSIKETASTVENRKKFKIPDQSFLFGTVTRLDPIKGNDFLITAMADVLQKFPDTYLIVVGDGGQKESLKQKCHMLHIEEHIKFLGHQKDIVPFLSLMDVFVLPSLNEGMGRVILEAMAMGRPVIATRTGGIPDLIDNNLNGVLVPSGDAQQLSTAMLSLITDQAKRRQLGEKGKETVSEKFSLNQMIRDIDKLYTDLL